MTRNRNREADPALLAAVALARQCARIEERIDSLSSSLALAWRKIERFEQRGSLAPQPPAPATPQRSSAEQHVSASKAAKLLDIDTRSVRRMINARKLRGSALPLTGKRRRWIVETADLERLIGAGVGSSAAPVTSRRGES